MAIYTLQMMTEGKTLVSGLALFFFVCFPLDLDIYSYKFLIMETAL